MEEFSKKRAGVIFLGLLGIVFEAVFLAAYIVYSRLECPEFGKSLIISLAAVTMALLIFAAATRAARISSLLFFPLVFALGYVIAFDLIEWAFFGGRIGEFESSSFVVAFLYGAYLLATFVMFGAANLFRRAHNSFLTHPFDGLGNRES